MQPGGRGRCAKKPAGAVARHGSGRLVEEDKPRAQSEEGHSEVHCEDMGSFRAAMKKWAQTL
eukprot:4954322-Lingulodinium_polyedra.AAC.1